MARRWAWVGILVGGVALFEIVRRVLVETQNPNLLPSLLATISLGLLTWFAHLLARELGGVRQPVG